MNTAGLMEPDSTKAKMKAVKESIDPGLAIPGRAPQPGDPELPSSLKTVRKIATEAGWGTEIIYARGIISTPKLAHVYALRMRRLHQRITAVWEADARLEPLKWKFTYAATLGAFAVAQKDKPTITPKAFPFTLSSDEMKGIIKAPPLHRVVIMDTQYEAIKNEDKREYFIPESEFRAPYKRSPKPKKEAPQQLEGQLELELM